MSEGRKPAFRLTYKGRDGQRVDVGVCWPSDRFPGLFDVKPEKSTGKINGYDKMRLSEAAARCEAGDGFISLAAPKPPSAESRSGGNYDRPSRSDMDDPDGIPF